MYQEYSHPKVFKRLNQIPLTDHPKKERGYCKEVQDIHLPIPPSTLQLHPLPKVLLLCIRPNLLYNPKEDLSYDLSHLICTATDTGLDWTVIILNLEDDDVQQRLVSTAPP